MGISVDIVDRMSAPRVFVSFASEDNDARLELGRELARQGLDSYDYSVPHEGSQVGMLLEEQIAGEIERADLFVALISDASTAPFKSVIHGEIRHALEKTRLLQRNRLIGVVLHAPRTDTEGRIVTHCSPPYYHCLPLFRFRDILSKYPEFAIELKDDTCRGRAPMEGVGFLQLEKRGDSEAVVSFPVFFCDEEAYFQSAVWNRLLGTIPSIPAEMLGAASRRTWLGPFARLQKRAWTHVDWIGPGCFAGLGKLVCERLGLNFQRPAPEDSRLPFYENLHSELWELPNHVRESTLAHLDYFSARIPVGSWEDALSHVKALRSILHQHHRDSYYARVIEGLCLLRLGRSAAALRHFDELITSVGDAIDENALGGRAKALAELGRRTEALATSREAVALCARKDDLAPRARLDWITMAIESKIASEEQGEGYQSEWEAAMKAAERYFRKGSAELGVEEKVKFEKLRARYLSLTGCTAEALGVYDQLGSCSLLEIDLPHEYLSGFPAISNNSFFARLADHGLFIDSPRNPESNGGIAVKGNPKDFHLVENKQAYRFRLMNGNQYRLDYVDLELLVSRHLLRWDMRGSVSTRDCGIWLDELEDHLPLFPEVGLIHLLILHRCQLGDGDRALDLAEKGLMWFPDDPQILQDNAYLLREAGNRAKAQICLERSARAAREKLLSASAAGGWTMGDLIEFWATAHDMAGREGEGALYRRLRESSRVL